MADEARSTSIRDTLSSGLPDVHSSGRTQIYARRQSRDMAIAERCQYSPVCGSSVAWPVKVHAWFGLTMYETGIFVGEV